jgi:hypothetical protein
MRQTFIGATGLALVAALVAISIGCGSSSPTSPKTTTETYSGTLTANTTNVVYFSTSAGGTLTATLTSITPVVTIGVGLGSAIGGACALQYANESFTQGTVWTTSVSGAGSFCLTIYDTGNVVQSTAYTVTLVHP